MRLGGENSFPAKMRNVRDKFITDSNSVPIVMYSSLELEIRGTKNNQKC